MSSTEENGELHTLGLLEKLRDQCKGLWGASSDAYFRVDELLRELANPNLFEIFPVGAFRVEVWDRNGQHIRWVIAASSSIAISNAAFDVAVSEYRSQRVTLRKGAMVLREHLPPTMTT
jgi:hypothetical protein